VLAEDGIRASQVSELRFEGSDFFARDRVRPQLEQLRLALTGRGREKFRHCGERVDK
jgi:hypothetical protein